MAGKRIVINGTSLDFTTENSLFKTDITTPINQQYPGSVTAQPIYDDGSNSILLLEKVINIKNGNKCFWFMWYKNGIPAMPGSSVIDVDDITEVIRNISKISF